MSLVSSPLRPAEIRRILLIRWGALGDVVVCSAILEDVRKAFPGSEIDVHTMSPCDRLFESDPRITRLLRFDVRGSHARWRTLLQWLRTVRSNDYDLVIDLQNNDRSRLLLGMLQSCGRGIPHRIGTRRGWPYNIAPPPRSQVVSALEYFRAALRAAGIPVMTERATLHVPEASRLQVRELQTVHELASGRFAVFMPGSGARGRLKRWGASHYAELSRKMLQRGIDRIVLIGSGDDADECAAVARLGGAGIVNLCNRTTITEVAALCADARCTVANDTGTAHVAAASACPLVVICGPTDPRRVKPPGDNIVAVQAELPCVNCYQKACAHHTCMLRLGPDAILAAIERLKWRGEAILR